MDLVVKNALIVSDGAAVQADFAVTNGVVTQTGHLEPPAGARVIDGTNRIVLPGLVEPLVTLLDEGPHGPACEESLGSVTAQAARGGVTTLAWAIEVSTDRPLDDVMAEHAGRDAASANVDVAYHLGLTGWSAAHPEIAAQARRYGGTIWAPPAPMAGSAPGSSLVLAAAEAVGEGGVLFTRLGDAVFERYAREKLVRDGNVRPAAFEYVLPRWLEAAALARLAAAARQTGRRVVVVGVSCRETLEEIERERARGGSLTVIAALPHLVLSNDVLEEDTAPVLPYMWPPLRNRSDQNALWAALEDGLVHGVTADHRPRRNADAAAGQGDCTKALPGAASLAHVVSLLYGEGVAKWRTELETLSLAACADNARLLGLYPRKGTLQIGSDADFILLDPGADGPRHSSGPELYNPYSWFEPACQIEGVYLGGRCIHGHGATAEPCGTVILDRPLPGF